MRGALVVVLLSLLTLAAVPPAEPTPTPPPATWTPGPPQPKADSPVATTAPSPIFIPGVETSAPDGDTTVQAWLRAAGIVIVVILVAGLLWRLKPFRRER